MPRLLIRAPLLILVFSIVFFFPEAPLLQLNLHEQAPLLTHNLPWATAHSKHPNFPSQIPIIRISCKWPRSHKQEHGTILQLSPEGEVNSGGYIYQDAKRRGISLALWTDPEGDSCFNIYHISWVKIKKELFVNKRRHLVRVCLCFNNWNEITKLLIVFRPHISNIPWKLSI